MDNTVDSAVSYVVAENAEGDICQEDGKGGGFERKLEQARSLLIQNPLCRPILYRIVDACAQGRVQLFELEEYIQQAPEYTGVTQPPYVLIQWLLDVNALDSFELDDQGNEVTEERKAGLTEDEVDDLVVDFAYRTSEAGLALLNEFKPADRLANLLEAVPERSDTYIELLEFLTKRRTYAEIDELLCGRDVLMIGRAADERPLLPSTFVDKLAATGSIVYNGGWQISDEGKEFLERIREGKGVRNR